MKHLYSYIQEKLQTKNVYEIMCRICDENPTHMFWTGKLIKEWIEKNKIKNVEYISDFEPDEINRPGALKIIDEELLTLITCDKHRVERLYKNAIDSEKFEYRMLKKDLHAYVGPDVFFIVFENNPVRDWYTPDYYLAVVKLK